MVRVAAGDEQAVRSLLERYERPLFAFVGRHTGGRDVEDLFQETWLRVVRYAARFDPSRKFSTWLFQIAVNLCRDWHSRRPPSPIGDAAREPSQPGAADRSTSHEPSAAGDAGRSDRKATAALDAERLLATLSPAHREALVLRYYHDLGEAEVSEVLGIARGTVKSRVHTALGRLAALVAEEESR